MCNPPPAFLLCAHFMHLNIYFLTKHYTVATNEDPVCKLTQNWMKNEYKSRKMIKMVQHNSNYRRNLSNPRFLPKDTSQQNFTANINCSFFQEHFKTHNQRRYSLLLLWYSCINSEYKNENLKNFRYFFPRESNYRQFPGYEGLGLRSFKLMTLFK